MGGQGDQWQCASPQENHLCRHFFNTSTGGKDRTNMATDRQKDREKISPQENHFKTIFIFKQSLLCTNFEAMPETSQSELLNVLKTDIVAVASREQIHLPHSYLLSDTGAVTQM